MNKKLQDLVWSVLPKEFKEEVKNSYEHTDSCSREEDVLESIFGEHNLLTSDAEGEDEMLMCKRKDIQFYYQYHKAKSEAHLSVEQKAYYKGRAEELLDLFDSKCLPDEKDDCQKFTQILDDILEGEIKEPFKDWYDKKYSNVEKLEKNGEVEPKPFKYKVGQKVILHFYGGEVSTITEAFNDGGVWNKYKVKALPTHVWNENELDPYEEPVPSEPKYHKGEKVNYNGYVYEVEGLVGKNRYALKGLNFDLDEDMIEPYTEPKEESLQMKPIESKVRVYLVTKEEDEEFRQLLHKNGFEWNTGESLIDNSVWSFDKEESKIHNIYPNKIVTYSGDITPNILSFYKFKKQYFEENVNLSQETANCDKHFDNILKDCFSKERRLNIAAMITQGIMANPNPQMVEMDVHRVADLAILMADTLIAECGKGDKKWTV